MSVEVEQVEKARGGWPKETGVDVMRGPRCLASVQAVQWIPSAVRGKPCRCLRAALRPGAAKLTEATRSHA